MCLIAFALNSHPDYPLVLAANRDEFYERPTMYAHEWADAPWIVAGRDLQGRGTWIGVTKQGKVAAVTNYRDPHNIRPNARTRGDLTKDFLMDRSLSAVDYLEGLREAASEYNGFNLLLFEQGRGYHFSNYEGHVNELQTGIFALSNALLDTPWPKLERLKKSFTAQIAQKVSHEGLLRILEDSELAPDDQLPDTGIGYEWEKAISSICIKSETYGTCCSTVLTIDKEGTVDFTERSFPVGQRQDQVAHFAFGVPEVAPS